MSVGDALAVVVVVVVVVAVVDDDALMSPYQDWVVGAVAHVGRVGVAAAAAG